MLQSTSQPVLSTSSLVASQLASSGPVDSGSEIITQYNQQGFPTVVTVPAGWSTIPKSYDSQGFLITPAPSVSASVSTPASSVGQKAADTSPMSTSDTIEVVTSGAVSPRDLMTYIAAFLALFVGLLIY